MYLADRDCYIILEIFVGISNVTKTYDEALSFVLVLHFDCKFVNYEKQYTYLQNFSVYIIILPKYD
jgi:hypothetical protein